MQNSIDSTAQHRDKSIFIDLAKAVAIFLMLWGHCIQYCIPASLDFYDNIVYKIIYSFHMPFFMIISGYLFYFSFQKRELKSLLTYKTQGLLHSILGGTIFVYLTAKYVSEILSGNYWAILEGGWLDSLKSLWFLWSILSASIVVGFVCKKTDKLWQQLLFFIPGILFVLLSPCGVKNVFMFPYYVLGFYFAKYKNRIPQKVLNVKYLSIPLYIVLIFFFEKKHYIYTTGLWDGKSGIGEAVAINSFRWLIGLIGCIAALCILEIIYKTIVCKTPNATVWKLCRLLGTKSLQIYVLSVSFLSAYLSFGYPIARRILPSVDAFFEAHIWIYNLVFTLLLALLYSVVLPLIVKLFEKIKIAEIIFGR